MYKSPIFYPHRISEFTRLLAHMYQYRTGKPQRREDVPLGTAKQIYLECRWSENGAGNNGWRPIAILAER
jgi:hypothetical protein